VRREASGRDQVLRVGVVPDRQLTPVRERERVFTLDALRGVAILGVVIANVLTFAFPAWSTSTPTGAESMQGSRLLVGFLVEGKFYVLFAVLFGMGLGLQSTRANAADRAFAGVYARRLGVLLLFGLAHGVFLYSGDILAFYAVLGLVAMALRRLPQRALLVLATGLLLANVSAIGVHSMLNPGSVMPTLPDWERLLEKHHADGLASAASEPGAGPAEPDRRLAFLEIMADETRIFRSGSWWERTRHRAFAYVLVGWPLRLLYTSWRVLGFFLLGICLVRRAVFLEAEDFRNRYLTWLWSGLLIGIILQMAGAAVQVLRPGNVGVVMLGVSSLLGGGLVQALAYASGVAWLCLRRRGQNLLRPVAAVGRMALTNYLLSSIVFGLVFYNHGLGLFGQLTTTQALAVALALYSAQLIFSSWWLDRFQFGPFEWVWRSATYWRVQPLHRATQG